MNELEIEFDKLQDNLNQLDKNKELLYKTIQEIEEFTKARVDNLLLNNTEYEKGNLKQVI